MKGIFNFCFFSTHELALLNHIQHTESKNDVVRKLQKYSLLDVDQKNVKCLCFIRDSEIHKTCFFIHCIANEMEVVNTASGKL